MNLHLLNSKSLLNRIINNFLEKGKKHLSMVRTKSEPHHTCTCMSCAFGWTGMPETNCYKWSLYVTQYAYPKKTSWIVKVIVRFDNSSCEIISYSTPHLHFMKIYPFRITIKGRKRLRILGWNGILKMLLSWSQIRHCEWHQSDVTSHIIQVTLIFLLIKWSTTIFDNCTSIFV